MLRAVWLNRNLSVALVVSAKSFETGCRMRTVESVGATFATCTSTLRSGSDDPTISSNIDARSISSRNAKFSFRILCSACLRSSISVPVAYQRMIFPLSSRNGLYRTKNQRYCPSLRRARSSASNGSPCESAFRGASRSVSTSSGWKSLARKSSAFTSSRLRPV